MFIVNGVSGALLHCINFRVATDPAEGSGYTYTHDLGIQGMQQNLGLSDDQIIRKINVDDSDAQKTRTAIQECIDAGCNIIFSTSWGYMQTTAEMAE